MFRFWKDDFHNKLISWFLFAILILSILNCSLVNVNLEPVVATVTELSACKEWDETGKPFGVSKTFSPNQEQIFACGYVQTVQPIDLEIYWYFEDELVFKQIGENTKGYFYSFVKPGKVETFPEGIRDKLRKGEICQIEKITLR